MKDLWQTLKAAQKPILLYGMGAGAEKLLCVCEKKEIGISGVFCSDGFERGKSFFGMPVTRYDEAKEKFGDFTVLVAFGTARDEVLANIARIAAERQTYIPDLPVAGETLFDGDFYEEHRARFEEARALFADARSKEVFDAVIDAKLYGRLEDLERGTSARDEDFDELLHPETYRHAADLGAYDGDSARYLLGKCPDIRKITALEPDDKTYERLKKKTEGLPVEALRLAAWDRDELLTFTRTGNRGAGVGAAGGKTAQVRGVRGDGLFEKTRVDFIKFDVEGAEMRALTGLRETIARDRPEMLVSCYHRPEDLYELPLYLAEKYPFYSFYLRRQKGVPAWDIDLYCVKKQ